MTDLERQRLWHLVLKYEELEAPQRQAVDRALNADPELQNDWRTLRGLEGQATLDWELAKEDFWQPEMDDITAERCRHSLEEIMARVPQSGQDIAPFGNAETPATPASQGIQPWTRVLWPVAAVLALFLLFPRLATQPDLIGHLAVQTVEVAADGTRSAQRTDTIAEQLRTGQAFVLSLATEDADWLVVYHVDPNGKYAEVFSGQTTGTEMTIPDAATGGFWVLDGEPGPESFVVAAFADNAPDLVALKAALTNAGSGAEGHAAVVAALSQALNKAATELRVLSIKHVD